MSGLPSGWVDVEIGEIAEVVAGGTPKANDASNFEAPGAGIAWLTPADLSGYKAKEISHGSRDLSQKGYESCSAKLMPKGSLLFSSRAPIGYVALAANEISTNQGFKSFVFPKEIDPSYAFYYLKSIRQLADSLGTGTTFKELSGTTAKTLPFRMAPENEQTRIAQKLDELLPQVDTLKARIDAIPALLKRFRQSVLAAAVSGRLTEQDRISAGWETPRSVLLGACANTLDPNPSHRYPSYENGEIPILSTQDFSGYSGWSFSNAKLVNRSFYEERRVACGFQESDVIFARKGRLGLARKAPADREYVFSHTVFIVRAKKGISSDYLLLCLRPDSVVDWLMQEMNSNTGVPTLGKKIFEQLPIFLPCELEQTEIVRRVEQLFTFADQVEAKVATALARINHLTQSILAKAFRGELVPQDPNDEPASVLLERIQAQRAATPKAKRGRKTSA
ncbi:restriction endonuclease subunit S [Pseudomonas paralcaligenes]|uniref:restriction endonuclease subunit S n=1 Tax=Pseudomonas paralcaligenes TaxID=2772558 RepID=UPI001C80DF53|nr:restriction endonuclease subunit S [Pseudomonas paralcaligenes]